MICISLLIKEIERKKRICNNHHSSEKGWTLVNFCEFDSYASQSYCAIHNVDQSINLGGHH